LRKKATVLLKKHKGTQQGGANSVPAKLPLSHTKGEKRGGEKQGRPKERSLFVKKKKKSETPSFRILAQRTQQGVEKEGRGG